jgi:hypothetical protein
MEAPSKNKFVTRVHFCLLKKGLISAVGEAVDLISRFSFSTNADIGIDAFGAQVGQSIKAGSEEK